MEGGRSELVRQREQQHRQRFRLSSPISSNQADARLDRLVEQAVALRWPALGTASDDSVLNSTPSAPPRARKLIHRGTV